MALTKTVTLSFATVCVHLQTCYFHLFSCVFGGEVDCVLERVRGGQRMENERLVLTSGQH